MIRSPKNKTLQILAEERDTLAGSLLTPAAFFSAEALTDRILHGDLFSVLPSLPSSFVDLMIIDPPYNLSKDYNGASFRECSDPEYAAYVERWLPPLLRLLKKDASLYVCCDWRSSHIIYSVLARHAIVRNRITWQREKGRGAARNWKNAMEDIWFATCSEQYYFDVGAVKMKRRVIAPYRSAGTPKDWAEEREGKFRLTHPSNFWDDISIPYWSMPENTSHPTQKPEKLLAKLILASSAPGAFVFDPFLGSGTTAVTARKLGRHYAGVEQSLEYCLFAQKRLELAGDNPRIQGYTDGFFWERNTLAEQRKSRKKSPSDDA